MTQPRQHTVAVVGFDSVRLAVLSRILTEQGLAVTAFTGADRAAEACREVHPDLFVSALEAPDLEGWRLCRRLRASRASRVSHVPILMLSETLAGEEARRSTADLGGDELLSWPADAETLVACVRRLLSDDHAGHRARRRAKEALRESYRQLFSHMLDACAMHEPVLDADGRTADFRFLAVNPAFEQLTGLSGSAILGKTIGEVLPEGERYWLDEYAQVAETGEARRLEIHQAALGKYLEGVAFRPAPGRVACIFKDITERKENERRTRRLISLNELLHQVNQAIVRAASPEDLFASTCRIATRCGEFRLTWIGMVDQATGELRPCAQDADAAGIPFPIRVHECGVALRAISQSAPAVCNSMAAGQSAADCHPNAMDVGIRSCAAFPIYRHSQASGALTVHSAEEGFFQDAEVRRLEAVALDLSFALDKLEAEHARQEVEQRFAIAFEHFPAAAAIRSYEDGSYLDVNRQFETVFGYSRSEALGKAGVTLGMVTPETAARLTGLLARDGRVSGEEIHVRAKDGRVVECLANAELITVQGQRRILSMLVDVTAHKQMEEAVQESEATLRRLCDSTLDAIVMVDSVGQVILWNPAAEQMFGYTAREIMGRPIHDLAAPPHARSLFRSNFPVFQSTGQGTLVGKLVEATGLRRDGSEFPMELSLAAIPKRQQWQAVAIIRDVTARYEARKEIDEANRLYELLAEQSRTVFWQVDAQGLYTHVGPVAETVWGYRPEELVGQKHFYDLHPEEGREAFKAAAFEVLERLEAFRELANPVQCKDGHVVWMSTTGMPFRDENGRFLGYRGSDTDITDRQRAEEQRRQSDRLYRSLFENMLDAFAYCKMVYDEQGHAVDAIYLEVNSVYERAVGAKSIVGRRVTDVIPGVHEMCPELLGHYARVASTGKSERFELYFAPGRQWRSISAYSPAKGYVITVIDDISERKRQEQNQETMVALLRLLNASDNTRELIRTVTGLLRERSGCEAVGIRMRHGGGYRYFETRGVPAEFVETESGLGVLEAGRRPPGERPADTFHECRCAEVLSGRFDPNLPYFTTGGSFWTNSASQLLASPAEAGRRHGAEYESVALIPLRSGGQTFGLLQFSDSRPDRFTAEGIAVLEQCAASVAIALQQRRTQEALRLSEERYRLISENTVDVIWLVDVPSRVFSYASPSVFHLLGYTPEELLTKERHEILTPESHQYAEARIAQALTAITSGHEAVRPLVHQLDAIRKDGSIVRIEVVAKFLPDAQGRIREMLGVARDITERLEAEARLMQAQKMESVGRLAGGVAHDFNNLLTVINGYSEMLMNEVGADDPLRDRLEEIRKAGRRAAGLTQQLLAFSRKQVLQPRLLDFNKVIADMRPMLARLVGEDVELRVELYPAPAAVCADPHQLEQVLMNLAVNSRDAMPHGGKLSIETAVVEWDASEALSRPGARAGAYVMLAVSDTGAGMDEETRRHIFEPFFTTKEVGKGTGLGLSMTQGIVAQSGGHIEVSSEPGHGATFRIYLPAVESLPSDAGNADAVSGAWGKETVLVVEDQPEVRRYAAAALNARGYRVIQAESAGEALSQCERGRDRIDLVLTDVVMPNMSGRELADRLAQRWPGMKVLFMSGYTDDAVGQHGVLEEGVAFIQKPFSPDQLAVKVREMLAASDRRPRLLVADDEAGIRGFLRTVLMNDGYEVVEASNGTQALERIRSGRVDLAILDLVMPEQEGIETIRIMRKEVPGMGIIAMSGAFGGQFLELARMLGADVVLTKPIGTDLLLTKVAEVLQSRR